MKCPNCQGENLSWDSWFSTTIPPMGGGIPRPVFLIGCEDCSETVQRVELDTVAAFLNAIVWRGNFPNRL